MEEKDKLRSFYDNVSSYLDIGGYDDFYNAMQDEDRRQKFFDATSQYVDIGSRDKFNSFVGDYFGQQQPAPRVDVSDVEAQQQPNMPTATMEEVENEPASPYGDLTAENFVTMQQRGKELADQRKRIQRELDNDTEMGPLTASQRKEYESQLRGLDEEMRGVSSWIDEWNKTEGARAYYEQQKRAVDDVSARIDKMQADRNRERINKSVEEDNKKSWWQRMAEGLASAENPITEEVVEAITDTNNNDLRAARNEVRNAKNQLRLEEMRQNGEQRGLGFLRGMENANYYELMPAVGMADAMSILQLSKDIKDGKELTDSQKLLKEAMEARAGVDFAYQDNNTLWERIGQSAPEQLMFTAQFVLGAGLTGATEMGERAAAKQAEKYVARYANNLWKKVGEQGIKEASRYAERAGAGSLRGFIGTRALPLLEGMGVSSAIQTAVNPTSIVEDFEKRYAGDIYYDKDGNLHVFDNDRSAGQAAYQAIASAWIENFTEYAGANITKSAKLLDSKMFDLAGKFDNVMKTVGAGKIQDVFRIPQQLGRLTQIGSAPEEFLEEELGSVMNALMATDAQRGESYGEAFKNTISSSFAGEQQLETFLSCAITSMLLGGGGNAVNGVRNTGLRKSVNQDVEQSKALLGKVRGVDIEALDNMIENGRVSDISAYLKEQSDANNWNKDEQGAAVSYVLNRSRQIGVKHNDDTAIEAEQAEYRRQAEDMVNRWDGQNIYNVTYTDRNGETQEGTIVNGRVHYNTNEDGTYTFDPYMSSGMLAIRRADGSVEQVAGRNVTALNNVATIEEQLESQNQTIDQLMRAEFEQDGMLPTIESVWGGNLVPNVTQFQNGRYTYLGQDDNGLYAFANNDKRTNKDNPIVYLTERQLIEYGLSLNLENAQANGDTEAAQQAQDDIDFLKRLDEITADAGAKGQWDVVKAYAQKNVQLDANGDIIPDGSNEQATAAYLLAISEGSFENAIASVDQTIAALGTPQQIEVTDNAADNAAMNNAAATVDADKARQIDFYTNVRNRLMEMQQGKEEADQEEAEQVVANTPVSQMEVGQQFSVEWRGQQAMATVTGKDADGRSVVTVRDMNGEDIEAGIDDMSDAQWEGVRVQPQEATAPEQAATQVEPQVEPQQEVPQAAPQQEETPQPQQQEQPQAHPLDDFIAKHGENAENKLGVTIGAINKEIASLAKDLEKAEKDLANMPEPYDDKTQKAQDKQEEKIAKLRTELDEKRNILAPYAAMQDELDRRKEVQQALQNEADEALRQLDDFLAEHTQAKPKELDKADLEPANGMEFIADQLSGFVRKKYRINKESLKKETGWGDKEAKDFSSITTTDGGMTIQEMADYIYGEAESEGREHGWFRDPGEVRDMLIDLLQSTGSYKGIINYIRSNRESQLEDSQAQDMIDYAAQQLGYQDAQDMHDKRMEEAKQTLESLKDENGNLTPEAVQQFKDKVAELSQFGVEEAVEESAPDTQETTVESTEDEDFIQHTDEEAPFSVTGIEKEYQDKLGEIQDKIREAAKNLQLRRVVALNKQKAQLLQEYIDKIKTDDVTVLDEDTYIEVLRANGVSERNVAIIQAKHEETMRKNQLMGGFYVRGKIFVFANDILSIEHARRTYIHERQHSITAKDVSLLREVVAETSRDELAGYVRALSESDSYDNESHEVLADEFISMAMEEAYSTDDVEAALRAKGVNNEQLINTIKSLDNEQQTSDGLAKARRGGGRNLHVDNNAERGSGHDGQNQGRRPGEVEEQGLRPSYRGNEKTGDLDNEQRTDESLAKARRTSPVNESEQGDYGQDGGDRGSRPEEVGGQRPRPVSRGEQTTGSGEVSGIRYSMTAENRQFNKDLSELTEENADSKILSLGNPSPILLSAGIEDKPLILYGNKLVSKAKKHGFSIDEVRDLPKYVSNPIAVFDGSEKGSHAILTEIKIGSDNVLVSISVGENNDIDFNIISSVYGKASKGVVYWINNNKLLYTDKEKTLDYLRTSAPIADARLNQEFDSAAKIVKDFENPTIPEKNNSKPLYSVTSQSSEEEKEETYFNGEPRFSVVADRSLLLELERSPKVKVYRAMQMRDGKLYPPMAGKVNGEWQNPIELGVWEQADEHPELVDENGKFKLDKGNGKTIKAAYNPYLHTSRSPLNDQFSSAWDRPELVTVEVEVPESELTSGYKAEKAKDAVGEVEWKSGPVSGKLAKNGNPRKVILSRYDKPIRIVPAEEVAERIAEMLEGTGLSIPFNTVTPELRDALVAQGAQIGKPQKGNAGNSSMDSYNEWKEAEDLRFSTNGTHVINNGKSLVGIHNIGAEKLRKAMKNGGFANPSAAVIDIDKQEHKGYGEVSLIMPSSLVDSRTGRNAGTYAGDAYTPEYPNVTYSEGKNTDKLVRALVKDLPKELGWAIQQGIGEYMDGNRSRSALEYLFLKEKGQDMPIVKNERRYPDISTEQIDKRLGVEESATRGHSGELYAAYEKLEGDDLVDFNMWFEAYGDEEKIKQRKDLMERNAKVKEMLEEQLGEHMGYGKFDTTWYNILRDERDAGKENIGRTLEDAAIEIDNQGLRSEFEQWKQNVIDGLGYEEVIFDGYTPSGYRRYVPNTVENASRIMNKKGKTNWLSDAGTHATKAMLLDKFNTLNDIRKNRGLLESDQEVINQAYEEASDAWSELGSELAEMQKVDDNRFINHDIALNRLQEAMMKSNPAAYLNKEYKYNLDEAFNDRIKEVKQQIKSLPSKYFETKFRRPVYLNEFAAAVVPNDLPQDLKERLQQSGLPLFEYDPNKEGDRRAVTLEATEGDGIRFSVKNSQKDVDDNQLSLFLQNNTGEYETQDGQTLGFTSLLGAATEASAVRGRDNVQRGDDILQYRLRRLEPGETCHVERRYQKSKMFDFTGSEKIESVDDVAYIFNKLEDAAVENSFVVLLKDGKPTIIHTGVGGYGNTYVSIANALVAYKNINPDAVWFVHNHPGGSITSSQPDRDTSKRFEKVFGKKFKGGIIIDTTSGKYGVFDSKSDTASGSTRNAPKNENDIDVYAFSKQVFDKNWNPETSFYGRTQQDIATFVSSHRLGEHDKMSLLVLNNNLNIVGNVFLPYTNIGEADIKKLTDDSLYYMNQMAGTQVVIYGSFTANDVKDINKLATNIGNAEGRLLDVISTNSDYTGLRSVRYMGALNEEMQELKEDEPRFSVTAQQDKDYMDAVNRGDMETAQRMVNEAAKAAMPNTKVVDENGNPKVMYHGSVEDFNTFDKNKIREVDYDVDVNGFWFTDKEYMVGPAMRMPNFVRGFFINSENPAHYKEVRRVYKETSEKMRNDGNLVDGARSAHDEVRMRLEDEGFDGVYVDSKPVVNEDELNKKGSTVVQRERSKVVLAKNEEGTLDMFTYSSDGEDHIGNFITGYDDVQDFVDSEETTIVVFEPNQIKSADPVTYDDQGNVIPLSERFNPNNNDIRFSVTGQQRIAVADEFNRRSGANMEDVGTYTRIKESLIRDWFDGLHPLEQVQKLIEKALGRKLRDSEKAYELATQTTSVSAAMIDEEEKKHIIPILNKATELIRKMMNNDRLSREEAYRRLSNYMLAKHGLERNKWFHEQALQSDPNAEEEDKSGLTGLAAMLGENPDDYKAVAERIVKEFEDEYDSQEIDDYWDEMRGLTNRLLEISYESGMIDKDTYDSLKKRHKFYVPLRGFGEEMAGDMFDYIGQMPHFQETLKKAKGRKSVAGDPFANLYNMLQSAIVIGNQNKVMQKLYNLAVNSNNDLLRLKKMWYVYDDVEDRWEERYPDIPKDATEAEIDAIVKKFDADMQAAKANGKAKTKLNKLDLGKKVLPYQAKEHEMVAYIDGKKVIMQVVGNPVLAQALNKANNKQLGVFAETMQGITRFMSMINTSLSPAFMLTNSARDIGFALFSAMVTGGFKKTGQVAAWMATSGWVIPRLMITGKLDAGLVNALGKQNAAQIEQWWNEFTQNGGETGFTRTLSAEKARGQIDDMIRHMLNGSKDGESRLRKSTVGLVESAGRWSEDISRFAAYCWSRSQGNSVMESVNEAKNVTVNFNVKGGGRLAAACRAVYSFFNAALQGVGRMARLAKENPKAFAACLTACMLQGAVLPWLNMLMFGLLGGDDDDWKKYEMLTEYTANKNLVLYVGNHKFLKIPYSQELAPFAAMGNIFFRQQMGWNKGESVASQVGKMFLDLSPVSIGESKTFKGKLAKTVTPTAAKWFTELLLNEDFTGSPIQKENAWNKYARGWEKAYEGKTSKWLVDASKWLDDKTGIDISPAVAEHMFTSVLGGIGRSGDKLLRFFSNGFQLQDAPFIRTLMFDSKQQGYVGAVQREYGRNAYDVLDKVKHDVENMDAMEFARFSQTEEFEIANLVSIYKTGKDLAGNKKDVMGIDKMEKEYKKMAGMSDGSEEYREHLEAIKADITERKMELLDEIEQIKYEHANDLRRRIIDRVKEVERESKAKAKAK